MTLAQDSPPDSVDAPAASFLYDVFISYSRHDAAFARALERTLSKYKPPPGLAVPQRHLRVFRDETDMSGNVYPKAIRRYITASRRLIVVCSPAAYSSAYVNEEIRLFAAEHGDEAIIPVLVAGLANNEAPPGREAEHAFPAALVERMTMPLAADFRGQDVTRPRIDRGGFEGPWHKLLADLYGIQRREVEQREKRRRERTIRIWGTGITIVAGVLVSLTFWALYSRDEAVRQREAAVRSESKALAALADVANRGNKPVEAATLALAAWPRNPHDSRPLLRRAVEALSEALGQQPLLLDTSPKPQLPVVTWQNGALELPDGRILSWGGSGLRILASGTTRPSDVHVDIEDGTVDGALLLRDGNILFWSDGYKSSERKLRLWNPSTGKTDDPKIELRSKLVGALEMHSGHILAWDDWALRVWDLRSGKQIGEEMRHEGGWLTNAYEMSNGRILSVSNTHQTVQLWEAGKELVRKRDMAAIAMPDSRIVSWNAQGRSWEQPESSFLRVWTPDFGESSVREARVEAFIRNALVLSNRRVLFVGSDGLLRSWDVANGEQAESAAKHDGAVSGVRLTADGRILSWSEDNTLRLWEAHSLRQIGAPMPHEDHINGALAMTNGRILSWTSSTILYLWHGNREMASDVQSISGAIRLPDDQFLWWSRATLHILNSRTGRSTELGTHGESKVVGGLVLRNGHVLTWSEDGMLRLWNLQERRQIGDDMQHGEPAVEAYETPDNAILSWSYDGTMNLWDQSTGKPIGQTMRHGDRMDGALITTTRRVFSWANDGTLKLWISGTGEPVHVVPEMHHVRPVRALETRYGRILTWSADGTLRLWSSINGDPAGTPMAHESKVVGARAMRDGRRIASWSNDGKLRLSDLNDDRQTGPEIDLAAPAIDILEMSDGRILYWSDSELGLWNPTDGENFKFETTGPNFKSEQPHWFLGALEMPNKRILSWSSDGGLRLWDPTTGFVIGPAMRVGAGFVHGAIVASDGMMLSWSDDGGALWRDGVPDGTLFEAACKLFMPSMDHKEIAKRSGVVFSNPPCESPFRVPFNQKALKGTQIE